MADDDIWRMRILLHEFGVRWESTPLDERVSLVEGEPGPASPPWDAFVAAYVEHRCHHDGFTVPGWVFGEARYLDGFWFPFPSEWKAFGGGGHGTCASRVRRARHPVAERDLIVV